MEKLLLALLMCQSGFAMNLQTGPTDKTAPENFFTNLKPEDSDHDDDFDDCKWANEVSLSSKWFETSVFQTEKTSVI